VLARRLGGGETSAVGALSKEQVRQVRLRYEAFFGQTRGTLDGAWAWEDTRAGYLLLDTLTLREEANGLARLLFEDFAHYFTTRKPREEFCVLIVDEFSALANGTGMAGRVEQARGFRTSLILAPQVVAGMGEETEAARILGSVETVVCHRVNTPEEIIALAGTRMRPEYSMHYGHDGASGEGSARIQHQFKVNPNKVRALAPGEAFLISRGRAMRAQVLQAPRPIHLAHRTHPSTIRATHRPAQKRNRRPSTNNTPRATNRTSEHRPVPNLTNTTGKSHGGAQAATIPIGLPAHTRRSSGPLRTRQGNPYGAARRAGPDGLPLTEP
jgi:hypothetical protein